MCTHQRHATVPLVCLWHLGNVQPGYPGRTCLPSPEGRCLHCMDVVKRAQLSQGSELERPRLPLAGGWRWQGSVQCRGGFLALCALSGPHGAMAWIPPLDPCHGGCLHCYSTGHITDRGLWPTNGPTAEMKRHLASSLLAKQPEVHGSDNAYRATFFLME